MQNLILVTSAIAATYLAAASEACGASIALNLTGTNQVQAVALGGFDRPDSNGAVGPHHIVEMINGVYTVYDKATGQLLQRMSLNDFWVAAGRRGVGPLSVQGDPRVVYDPTVDRWYAVGLPVPDINLAVSISGDPTFPVGDLTRGWKGLLLDGDPANEPDRRWADYPGFGFDADGIYVTAQLLNLSGPLSRDYMVVSIPKADLLSSNPTIANRTVFEISGEDVLAQCAAIILQPVVDVGASDGISPVYSANGTLGMQRWNIANAGTQSPGQATLSGPFPIPIDPFIRAPGGKQPNNEVELSSFTTGSPTYGRVCPSGELRDFSKFNSALVHQGNSDWGAHAVNADGRAAIRWYELDATTGAVRQQGTISDPHLDMLYPSIAVNPLGDVVIGFTATGESKFPSAFAVVGDTVGGITQFGELMELKSGGGTFYDGDGNDPRNFWGDYSTTVLDPSDPYSFWTFQEFTQAKDQWAVQITQIVVEGPVTRTEILGPAAAYAVRDTDSGGALDGIGDMVSAATIARVGEVDSAGSNRVERLIEKFELPADPGLGERLESATLRMYLQRIEGTPAGPLSVLHSATDNDLDPLAADFEDASYLDTQQDLIQPTDVAGAYYEADVTDQVRADYAGDGANPLAAFRLEISGPPFLEDNIGYNYFLFAGPLTASPPQLVLSFLPEMVLPDYNGNGQVDQGDLDLVLLNWGADAAVPPAGWTNDLPTGLVDQGDLDKVLLNWGASTAVGGATVPEPAAGAILLATLPALALGVRRLRPQMAHVMNRSRLAEQTRSFVRLGEEISDHLIDSLVVE